MEVRTVGVLGAGTMGAGIARVALEHGFRVRLYDVRPIELDLAGLETTSNLADMADADVVIEAVVEDLAIKREVFATLDRVCRADALLASNTSSLSITAIAAACTRPERVVGLHFFNPVPRMALVEVVAGARSAEAAVERARELATRLGKTAILVKDTPGFVVNRVARSYYGEALRLVGDHGAAPATVDRALTLAAGFKMGPFALMDLIGIDVNLAVSESVWRSFYDEPRFRPHPLQRLMVESGRLGRKSGGGFYDYPAPAEPAAPAAPAPASRLRVALAGGSQPVAAWAARFAQAGHHVEVLGDGAPPRTLEGIDGVFELGDAPPAVRADRRMRLASAMPAQAWLASDDLLTSSLEIEAMTGRAAWRFGSWHGAGTAALELALPEDADEAERTRAAAVIAALGCQAVVVPDLPGLVGPRTIATLINEAAFAVEAGVAAPEAIDLAMRLGTAYPSGPLAWGDMIGPARVVALLGVLREAYGERYRPAPWLARRAAAGLQLAEADA